MARKNRLLPAFQELAREMPAYYREQHDEQGSSAGTRIKATISSDPYAMIRVSKCLLAPFSKHFNSDH
ncbi:MAG: hypothetical protein QM296_13020 [Bacillota bacterium]|nr:hypothetical protein [Bacillota bacterium]